ncbi:MAG: DUF364 domain-containing protein [Polyangia bacterium]|nr:DUF364 domain-containing protein [Polyangia bacterium]
MSLRDELKAMASRLGSAFDIPRIERAFFPPLGRGGQPREAEFMALLLEGGAVGVSYLLINPAEEREYAAWQKRPLRGLDPVELAQGLVSGDLLGPIVGLAALNAVCAQVIRATGFPLDFETDSLGLLDPSPGDRFGMVGLFPPLLGRLRASGADLVVLELEERLVAAHPDLKVTLDPGDLGGCNKVLCTATTVVNGTLDAVLAHLAPDATVSVVGPTLGFFPDGLFERGVDLVGGTLVTDGERFFELIEARQRWSGAARKFCLRRQGYPGMPAGFAG